MLRCHWTADRDCVVQRAERAGAARCPYSAGGAARFSGVARARAFAPSGVWDGPGTLSPSLVGAGLGGASGLDPVPDMPTYSLSERTVRYIQEREVLRQATVAHAPSGGGAGYSMDGRAAPSAVLPAVTPGASDAQIPWWQLGRSSASDRAVPTPSPSLAPRVASGAPTSAAEGGAADQSYLR